MQQIMEIIYYAGLTVFCLVVGMLAVIKINSYKDDE